jgi:CheY-like chemotaxis protein
MDGDLAFLRMLAVYGREDDRDLLRQAAASASFPIEVVEASDAMSARAALAGKNIDIAFLDCAIAPSERAAFVSAAREAAKPPFVILTATAGTAAANLSPEQASVDGVVPKPNGLAEARDLVERCIRARRSRVLLVDDSATMRSIVRKILASSRFPLEVFEAQEGVEALRQIASGKFDIVFLDYNMPGLNGVETLAEIKRQYPKLEVVMITSTAEEAVAERARAAGAAAFIKKPFYPADIDAVLHRIFGLRPANKS